jgi:hypothetical protein
MPHFIEFVFNVFIVRLIMVPQTLQVVEDAFDLLKPFNEVWKKVFFRVFERFLLQLLNLVLVLI